MGGGGHQNPGPFNALPLGGPDSLWVAPRLDLPPYLPSLALVGLGARQKRQ